jgi:hypothetical protein
MTKILIRTYFLYIRSNRDTVGNLTDENGTLRDQMRQTEKDTLDVISFLKKQDLDKDAEVKSCYHLKIGQTLFLIKIDRTSKSRIKRSSSRTS